MEYMSNLMGSIQYASTIWWFYENELINSWTYTNTYNSQYECVIFHVDDVGNSIEFQLLLLLHLYHYDR